MPTIKELEERYNALEAKHTALFRDGLGSHTADEIAMMYWYQSQMARILLQISDLMLK